MKEHTWTDGAFVYRAQDRRYIDDEPSILWGSAGERPKLSHNAPSGSVQETALAREILALAEENRALKEALVQAEARGRRAALESVLRGLRSEDVSQQRDAIIASVEWMLNENTPLDDLRGFVVWHCHDGDIVKLVRVSESEELVPGAVISVSYIPRPGEAS